MGTFRSTMLVTTTKGNALPVLMACIPAWGLWPTWRSRCDAPVPAFAPLNAGTQFLMSVVWGLTLGMIVMPSNETQYTSELKQLFDGEFDIRVGAVLLGGFMLGHGDHLGALSMQYISPGVAYPMYAGLTVIGGSALNYPQAEPNNVPLWACGLALVLLGITLLATSQLMDHRQDKQSSFLLDESKHNNPISVDQDGALLPTGASAADLEIPETQNKVSNSHMAMGICLAAGLCGSMWSPLSTYGRSDKTQGGKLMMGPYLCLSVFTFGQLLSLPSVCYIAGRIGGTGVSAPIRKVLREPANMMWGAVCGMSVSCGYMAYFLGCIVISPTVGFGVSACNPLLALAIDAVVKRVYNGAETKVKMLACGCVISYGTAIALLSCAI